MKKPVRVLLIYEPAPVVYVRAPAYYGPPLVYGPTYSGPSIRFGFYGGHGGHGGHGYHGGGRGHGRR
jgi:hypothetical protein